MLARLCLLVCVSYVAGQRPSFAGTRPIGYPELYDRPTTEGLGNRFGESDGTTQRLPVEAKGDRELVERLSKLPIDQQPFWLINWKALEEHRQNPQTYPQKPNIFIDNIPSSVTTSNINTNTNSNNINTPPNNNNTPPNNFNTAQNVNIPSNNPNTSPSILNTAQNINRPLNTLNTPPNNFNTAQNVNTPSNNPNTSPSNFNTAQSNQQNTNTNRPNLLNRNSGPIKVDNDKKPTTAIKDKVKPLSVIPVKDESKPEIHISTDEDEESFEDYSSFEIDKDSYKHGGKNVKQ